MQPHKAIDAALDVLETHVGKDVKGVYVVVINEDGTHSMRSLGAEPLLRTFFKAHFNFSQALTAEGHPLRNEV